MFSVGNTLDPCPPGLCPQTTGGEKGGKGEG